ncbi:uncharacterized protein EAF01_001690 [Botrytis porri]|uniref:uncharacterized protein n=1 Tax=Botrytis porri TaxID=87229 RepID=UPI0019000156|nr:uncharacterized protein EAF01_001690 [Botrytis porri]KAF7912669.1 hypothetical protein EAF01_001690 [Botrytis porri]
MYPQKERLCVVKYPSFVKVSSWKFLRNTSGKQRRFMGDKGIAQRGLDRPMDDAKGCLRGQIRKLGRAQHILAMAREFFESGAIAPLSPTFSLRCSVPTPACASWYWSALPALPAYN